MGRLLLNTKLNRATFWFGGLSAFVIALAWIIGSRSGSKLSGWVALIALVFAFCALVQISHRAQWHLLWQLRNRLAVAFVFIGVIPIVLLLLMGGVAGYLFAGQFATFVATSNLQSELHHLEVANDALAAQLITLERTGRLNAQIAGELTAVSDENFPQRTVTVWRGDRGFILSNEGALINAPPDKVPEVSKGTFSGFVIDRESLHLRALKRYDEPGVRLTVISNVPITPEMLRSATSSLGSVTLILPDRDGKVEVLPQVGTRAGSRKHVNSERVPPPSNWLDPIFRFYTLFNVVDWENGKSQSGAIGVLTRPSILYSTLFAALGDKTEILRNGLLGIAIFFGLIELVAFNIGMRLSRTITLSVAELYSATEQVNHGDLTHRIKVRGTDQMAALEQSFNSMT
jgi:sigma-B regulation protein RsbU (phosphoserine phosphatase)